MKRFRLLLLVVFLQNLIALTCLAQTTAPPAGAVQSSTPPTDDAQFWNETQIIKHVSQKQDMVFMGVMRIGRDLERPVDERVGAGYAFKINKYLTLMPTYLYVDYQPYKGFRVSEHRIVINATIKIPVGNFNFTDRNLVERRARHSNPDFTVYRNRLQIDHSAHIGRFNFRPFIADEVWYSTQTTQNKQFNWYRNRISAGIIKQLTEHFSGEFYYLRQNDGRFRPGNVHTIGTLFRYTI
jgi:hypothetical protein